MPLTSTKLSEKIKTALSDVIGTYTYPNDYTRSAIAVGNPPNEVKVSGLEVIIPMMPKGTADWLSDSLYIRDTYEIYLVKREGCTPSDFVEACSRMRRFFYNADFQYIPQNETIGSFEQYVIKYKHEDLEDSYVFSN